MYSKLIFENQLISVYYIYYYKDDPFEKASFYKFSTWEKEFIIKHETGEFTDENNKEINVLKLFKEFPELLKLLNPLNMIIRTQKIDMIKWLYDNGEKNNELSIDYAIDTGNIHVVKFVHENGALFNEFSMNHAIKTGNIDIIKFVYNCGAKIINEIPHGISSRYYLLKELSKNDNNHEMLYNRSISCAIETGNLNIIKLIYEYGSLFKDKCSLSYRDYYNDDDYYNGEYDDDDDDNEYVKYRIIVHDNDMNLAIKTGKIEIVEFLFSHGIHFDMHSFNYAIEIKNIDIMRLIYSNKNHMKCIHNFPCKIFNKKTMNCAINTKNDDIINYVKSIL